jgi:hypothetical protein
MHRSHCVFVCVSIVILAAAASIRVAAQSNESFRYQEIGINTDLTTIPARFPSASHEFCCKEWSSISLADRADEFRKLIARGTGQYRVQLSEKEAIGHVYYVSAEISAGIPSSLRLSFERPPEIKIPRGYTENRLSRCPPCAPVLADLRRRYGTPQGPDSSSEEALEHLTYSWRNTSEELKLDCGSYQGQRDVFAMDVIFTRVTSN